LITPSGLSIGTILKTKFYLKISASSEFSSVRKSIAPFIIQEPTDSPGWTLAERKTPFLLFNVSKFYFEVIVSISHLFPAKVSQRVFLVTN
jgi:hypothetical protein